MHMRVCVRAHCMCHKGMTPCSGRRSMRLGIKPLRWLWLRADSNGQSFAQRRAHEGDAPTLSLF